MVFFPFGKTLCDRSENGKTKNCTKGGVSLFRHCHNTELNLTDVYAATTDADTR